MGTHFDCLVSTTVFCLWAHTNVYSVISEAPYKGKVTGAGITREGRDEGRWLCAVSMINKDTVICEGFLVMGEIWADDPKRPALSQLPSCLPHPPSSTLLRWRASLLSDTCAGLSRGASERSFEEYALASRTKVQGAHRLCAFHWSSLELDP
jgi:hypothetical protein